MREPKSAGEIRFLLLGSMLLFAFCGALALLLDNYYLLCIPFACLLLLTSINGIEILFFSLLIMIPFSIEQKVTNSISTDFPDEILMWIITGIVGLVILFNSKLRSGILTFRHPIWNVIGLSIIWIAVSTVFSTHPIISFKYLLSKVWYISCFFLLPIFIFKKSDHLKRMFVVFVFAMLIVVFYAFVKQININFSFLHVNEAVRPFFRNHVNYSALLACTIPLLFIAFYKTKAVSWKLFLGIALVICFINLIFAYSRGAWLGLLCCPIFYLILKRNLLKRALVVGGASLLISVFILISSGLYKKLTPKRDTTIYHTNVQAHLKATYQLTDLSFAERLYRWTGGINMTKAKPIFGFGPNTFYRNYKAYTIPEFETWVSDNNERSSIHNYYLLQFAEQGLVGGALFIVLIFIAFVRIEKFYHSNSDLRYYTLGIGYILVVICVELFVNDLIETDKIGSIFFLSLASIIVLEKNTQNKKSAQVERFE